MASPTELELRVRRDQLVRRSGELRAALGARSQHLQEPLAWAERASAGWQWLLAHPGWVAGGAAALLVLRPGRTLRLAGRLLQAAQLWQRVLPLWVAFGPRRP
jgi:hypothetical protein